MQDLRLDLDGLVKSLLLLGLLGVGLGTHDAATPVPLGLLVLLHEALLDGLDELGELVLVLRADLGQGEGGSGLGMMLVYAHFIIDVFPNIPSCGRQCRDGPCP